MVEIPATNQRYGLVTLIFAWIPNRLSIVLIGGCRFKWVHMSHQSTVLVGSSYVYDLWATDSCSRLVGRVSTFQLPIETIGSRLTFHECLATDSHCRLVGTLNSKSAVANPCYWLAAVINVDYMLWKVGIPATNPHYGLVGLKYTWISSHQLTP